MNDVVTEFSVPAVVAAIKANLFECYRYYGRSPAAEFGDGPRLTWLLTGIPHPFLNGVLRARFAPEDADQAIEQTLEFFRSKGVTALSWWTEPGSQPADLGERLLAHGLQYTEGSLGMAADLLAVEGAEAPPGLKIERVQDHRTLAQWTWAALRGFGVPDTSASTCTELFAGLGYDPPLRNYLGTIQGEPVATAQLFLGAGVAGIYWVATVPEARRQGIGGALTLAPLLEARAMGYRVSILHASSMGAGVYRGLGFQEYCPMSHYWWRGERPVS